MIHLKTESGFVGDPIPFYWNGIFHLFYLKRTDGPLFWAHALTKDFITWEELPDAILPGGLSDCDAKGCWTGSVIENNGVFHIFYTGFNSENRFPQTICHAVSKDLILWEKDKNNPILTPDTKIYEKDDWRDPFVFWNIEEKKWWMLITARKQWKSSYNGCIALAKSRDLKKWEICSPLWFPEIFGPPECSDIFRRNKMWYLFFSDFIKTNYVFSPDLKSFYFPDELGIDSTFLYAAKCFHTPRKDYIVGWIPTLKGGKDNGDKEWGGYLSLPREIRKEYKNLYFKLPDFLKKSFKQNSQKLSIFITNIQSSGKKSIFTDKEFEDYVFNIKIENKKSFSFGIVLRGEENLSSGYFIEFRKKKVMIKSSPYAISCFPVIERVLPEEFENYDVWIINEKENLEIFVNDIIVLTGKTYNFKKGKIGLFVINGNIKVKNCFIKVL